MRKTIKKSEARTQQEIERLPADVAENERELRNGRTKEGRGKEKRRGARPACVVKVAKKLKETLNRSKTPA